MELLLQKAAIEFPPSFGSPLTHLGRRGRIHPTLDLRPPIAHQSLECFVACAWRSRSFHLFHHFLLANIWLRGTKFVPGLRVTCDRFLINVSFHKFAWFAC